MKNKESDYHISSILIHGKHFTPKWDYRHHIIVPMTSSSTFRLDSVQRGAEGFAKFGEDIESPIYIYDRLGEPTRSILEENLAFAEGGKMAMGFQSGMAAISAALGIAVKSGEEVICHKTIYGCTYSLLTRWYPRYNIKSHFVNLCHPEVIKEMANEKTRVVYLETPTNPTLEIIDLEAVKEIVEELNDSRPPENKIRIIVDNTFATPYCQRPLNMGTDIVVHSLTKNICGFGSEVGGVVIMNDKSLEPELHFYRKDFGGALSTKNAWPILVYGIPSLPLRMERQQKTAIKLANYLEKHPKVAKVHYPGLESYEFHAIAKKQMRDFKGNFAPGFMIYFILKGEMDEITKKASKFMDYLATEAYTLTLAVSLGQIRSLIEAPASMTSSAIPIEEQIKSGSHPGGIRISVGLEETEDLIKDLDAAFDQI